jgi:hypothetical protein
MTIGELREPIPLAVIVVEDEGCVALQVLEVLVAADSLRNLGSNLIETKTIIKQASSKSNLFRLWMSCTRTDISLDETDARNDTVC